MCYQLIFHTRSISYRYCHIIFSKHHHLICVTRSEMHVPLFNHRESSMSFSRTTLTHTVVTTLSVPGIDNTRVYMPHQIAPTSIWRHTLFVASLIARLPAMRVKKSINWSSVCFSFGTVWNNVDNAVITRGEFHKVVLPHYGANFYTSLIQKCHSLSNSGRILKIGLDLTELLANINATFFWNTMYI